MIATAALCRVCYGRADFFPESGPVCVVHVAVEDAAPVRSDVPDLATRIAEIGLAALQSQAAPTRIGRNERRVWRVRLAAALMAKVEAERAIGRAAEEREAVRESLATTRDALVQEIAASSKLERAATRALVAMRATESQGKAWPVTSGFAMAMRALAAALGKEAE